MDIQATRRRNLAQWVASHGGHAEVVRRRHLTPSQASHLSQVMNGYSFGERAARAMELRLGLTEMALDASSPLSEGPHLRGGVVHPLSLQTDDAPLVEWEQLMEAVPPAVFRVLVPDEALAPELAAGDELLIDRGVQPAAGDLVLVKDSTGAHYVRVYRQRRPGEWSAHALHPDIEPLEVARDGLLIVGVCVEERRRRRRSGVR